MQRLSREGEAEREEAFSQRCPWPRVLAGRVNGTLSEPGAEVCILMEVRRPEESQMM